MQCAVHPYQTVNVGGDDRIHIRRFQLFHMPSYFQPGFSADSFTERPPMLFNIPIRNSILVQPDSFHLFDSDISQILFGSIQNEFLDSLFDAFVPAEIMKTESMLRAF